MTIDYLYEDDFMGFKPNAKAMNDLIEKAIGSGGQPYDVASVFMEYFTIDKLLMIQYHNKVWYIYSQKKHRWYSTMEQSKFSKYLSIAGDYFTQTGHLINRKIESGGDSTLKKKADSAFDIGLKLKQTGYKQSVITELEGQVYWEGNSPIEEMMDMNGHIIHFKNGVYDFNEDRFREGKPDDYCKLSTKNNYKPWIEHSKDIQDGILDYLKKVFPDDGMRIYCLRIIANSLNGSKQEEVFYMLNGSGANSKSKYMSLIQYAIGEYYQILPVALLTQKRVASNTAQSSLVLMKGKRICVLQEPDQGSRINVGLMKELTGGDRITCRGLFKDPIEYKPFAKHFLTCNELPEISSDDGGTWRRIKVVEFISKFKEEFKIDDPIHNRYKPDNEIEIKLEKWSEAFIAYLIYIYKQEIGKKDIPPSVLKATAIYRKQNDSVASYIDEKIVFIEEPREKGHDQHSIYLDYKIWVRDNNLRDDGKRNDFYKKLTEKLRLIKDTDDVYKYITIRMNDDDEDDDEETTDILFPKWFETTFEYSSDKNEYILIDTVINEFFNRHQTIIIRNTTEEQKITKYILKPLIQRYNMNKIEKKIPINGKRLDRVVIANCRLRLV